jgi:hypothetical protein
MKRSSIFIFLASLCLANAIQCCGEGFFAEAYLSHEVNKIAEQKQQVFSNNPFDTEECLKHAAAQHAILSALTKQKNVPNNSLIQVLKETQELKKEINE